MNVVRARHYATGATVEVSCDHGRIAALATVADSPGIQTNRWVAPALFDLQFNGCLGHSFNSQSLTFEQVRQVVAYSSLHGIGGFLATVITNSFAAIQHAFRTLAAARRQDADIARAIPGYHLEGPYISPEDGPRGAHPLNFVRPPDWGEFCRWQEAAEGLIRLVTLSPEQDRALPFIEKLTAAGVVAAIGHTGASPELIRNAIAAGARLSTHLGNGCHAVLPRHDNYVWEQLAADGLWASVIPDGHHLPASVLKCITRVKTPQRLIITCDAGSLAGMPPGVYSQWGTQLEVLPEGKIVLAGTPFLGGSALFTDGCIGPMVRMAGVSLAEAIDMASVQPRRLLGLQEEGLRPGDPDRLLLFEWNGADLMVQSPIRSLSAEVQARHLTVITDI